MRRLLISSVAAVAALAALPAQAITFPAGGFFNAAPGPNGTFSGAFGNLGIAAGPFTDIFTFTLPTSGIGSGSVTTSVTFQDLFGPTDTDFGSVTINGVTAPIVRTASGQAETATALTVPITGLALNTITVSGTSRGSGSYGGQLTFIPFAAAAPEPGTWAMMILGFGIAGASFRYRRRSTTVTYA
jgi:hypothetical protein